MSSGITGAQTCDWVLSLADVERLLTIKFGCGPLNRYD